MKNLFAPDPKYTKTYASYERAEKEGTKRCVGDYEQVKFVVVAVNVETGIRFTPVFYGHDYRTDFVFEKFCII